MATAKDLFIQPIDSTSANRFVKAHHYSGKVVQNSQLHLGVFLADKLHGVMQFGPSLDKRKIQGLVSGTQWHEFLELNRMAFDDVLPRNSESRALAIAWRLLRKNAPQVKWVISFADGTQCGDGTIYRAAGFVLTGIKENNQIWKSPDNARESRIALTDKTSEGEKERARNAIDNRVSVTKGKDIIHSASLRPGIGAISTAARTGGGSSMKAYIAAGFEPLEGFQLRYIYFLDPTYRARLTVPELPYSEIEKRGAKMYKGVKPTTSGTGETDNAPAPKRETEGASPIVPLLEEE